MCSEPIIAVKELQKVFRIYDRPIDRLRQMISRKGRTHFREFSAIQHLSFQLGAGETLGVIGRNGAGKSTLLQMICGTLQPTAGEILVHGRIAALLELGAGFNPEFTGRENVSVAGALHGLGQESINERLPSILAFADIGDFVDQPVKTYSSGMFVRLAFAVIAHVDADILVVDEALAVGDVFFQQKCMRFLRDFQSRGGTLLFVSHDTAAVVNLCKYALWLKNPAEGDYLFGAADEVARAYLQEFYLQQERAGVIESEREPGKIKVREQLATNYVADALQENVIEVSGFHRGSESFGAGGASFVGAGFFDDQGRELRNFNAGDFVCIRLEVLVKKDIGYPAFGITFKDRLGQFILSESTDGAFRSANLLFHSGDIATAEFRFRMPVLLQGHYSVDIAFAEGIGNDHVQHHWVHDALSITSLRGRLVQGIVGLPDLEIGLSTRPAEKKEKEKETR